MITETRTQYSHTSVFIFVFEWKSYIYSFSLNSWLQVNWLVLCLYLGLCLCFYLCLYVFLYRSDSYSWLLNGISPFALMLKESKGLHNYISRLNLSQMFYHLISQTLKSYMQFVNRTLDIVLFCHIEIIFHSTK